MRQIKTLLANLTLRQKLTILVAAAVVFAAVTLLTRWNTERNFKPLYGNLAAEDAGAVIAKLRESNAEYRVADGGGTILVPSAKVAETRLQMAAAGLPKTGRIGWELFDKTNFGITDFSEQVNYHRALEGELERSISSLSEVEAARVHVTFGKESIFLESRRPAKASVVLRLRAGARVSPQNVLAVTHLVASAVEGLQPESISVVDMQGNLLSRPRKTLGGDDIESSEATLEYRQRLEKDLLAKIEATLAALLGENKFRAGVWVDCDFSSGEQSEETYDPTRSVMVTAQKTEDISGSALPQGGVPGTASNLPRPAARPASGSTGTTRRTENITYQSSRTVRRVKLPQGAIKRISVSVLVDHNVRWEGMRRLLEPPPPEKLQVIRELIAGAIGFQQDRGDQLIVESLPFEATLALPARIPAPAQPGTRPQSLPLLPFAVAGGIAVVLAVLFWLLRRTRRKPAVAELPKRIEPPARDPGDMVRKQLEEKLAEQQLHREEQARNVLNSLRLPPISTQKVEVLGKHVAEEARKDPQGVAHVLRSWMNDR